MALFNVRSLIFGLIIGILYNCIACQGNGTSRQKGMVSSCISDSTQKSRPSDEFKQVNAMLVLPQKPAPGGSFRIIAAGGENIRKAEIIVTGPTGRLKSFKSKTGEQIPEWRIDDFTASSEGLYKAELISGSKILSNVEFEISEGKVARPSGVVWKTVLGWDSSTEMLYSAWINALFYNCDENSSWPALHEVTRNKDNNHLYNYLSIGEDDPDCKNKVIMQPDCADNPFFLRAYFAWKLGLPFGYHLCDRGSLVRNPKTGQWITNETATSKTNSVDAFNNFLRRLADGVHSGTARTALDDANSDYYPVALEHESLRPGTVFADPYGHTLILVKHVPQTRNHPGLLLSVDAQPDGTVGIKRFWKGNFLFNTSGVIGEPGFKTFRPLTVKNSVLKPVKNRELSSSAGFAPFSLQQRKMKNDVFYHTMERLINPKPLDPESAMLDQISALHEQLKVRVISIANGEAYFRSNPGTVIPMPSSAAGIFLAGGQWENFSTPNRDLRLLIAMDAVLDFPDLVVRSPEDFNIPSATSPEQVRKRLQSVLDQKISELTISYIRTDGSVQNLTVMEILKRREAFEMACNPNHGIEIRRGAPENTD